MNKDEGNNTISYHIQEINNIEDNIDFNIEDLINEIESTIINDEIVLPRMINYHENCTIKELLLICDYYGFAKNIKANKLNKEEIINYLVEFEKDPDNSDIVFKRQNMWFYINELKNDKFMKKFVVW